MHDHHFYIIVALLLLVLYCMMYHSGRNSEGFDLDSADMRKFRELQYEQEMNKYGRRHPIK